MQHQDSASGSSSIEAVARAMSASQAALRRRILLVAKHRFARFGYEDTSLADIAHSADVSQVELLLHFENKLSILTAILEEGWDTIHPRLADIIATSLSARLAMLSILAFMMNLMDTDEDLARILLFEGRRPDPDSSEVNISNGYRRFMLTCNTLIERGQRDGSFRASYHPRVIASILMGAIEGIMRDRLLAEQENNITPYTGTYMISAFDGLVSYLRP